MVGIAVVVVVWLMCGPVYYHRSIHHTTSSSTSSLLLLLLLLLLFLLLYSQAAALSKCLESEGIPFTLRFYAEELKATQKTGIFLLRFSDTRLRCLTIDVLKKNGNHFGRKGFRIHVGFDRSVSAEYQLPSVMFTLLDDEGNAVMQGKDKLFASGIMDVSSSSSSSSRSRRRRCSCINGSSVDCSRRRRRRRRRNCCDATGGGGEIVVTLQEAHEGRRVKNSNSYTFKKLTHLIPLPFLCDLLLLCSVSNHWPMSLTSSPSPLRG